jgi:hypothetical protein
MSWSLAIVPAESMLIVHVGQVFLCWSIVILVYKYVVAHEVRLRLKLRLPAAGDGCEGSLPATHSPWRLIPAPLFFFYQRDDEKEIF